MEREDLREEERERTERRTGSGAAAGRPKRGSGAGWVLGLTAAAFVFAAAVAAGVTLQYMDETAAQEQSEQQMPQEELPGFDGADDGNGEL